MGDPGDPYPPPEMVVYGDGEIGEAEYGEACEYGDGAPGLPKGLPCAYTGLAMAPLFRKSSDADLFDVMYTTARTNARKATPPTTTATRIVVLVSADLSDDTELDVSPMHAHVVLSIASPLSHTTLSCAPLLKLKTQCPPEVGHGLQVVWPVEHVSEPSGHGS